MGCCERRSKHTRWSCHDHILLALLFCTTWRQHFLPSPEYQLSVLYSYGQSNGSRQKIHAATDTSRRALADARNACTVAALSDDTWSITLVEASSCTDCSLSTCGWSMACARNSYNVQPHKLDLREKSVPLTMNSTYLSTVGVGNLQLASLRLRHVAAVVLTERIHAVSVPLRGKMLHECHILQLTIPKAQLVNRS